MAMSREAAKRAAFEHIDQHYGGDKARKRGVFAAYNRESITCGCSSFNHGRGWQGPPHTGHHPNCVKHLLESGARLFLELVGEAV